MNLQLSAHKLAEEIFRANDNSVSVGAGEDDAAVFSTPHSKLAVTSDFRSSRNFSSKHAGINFSTAGILSVRQNVSDIYAMGAFPKWFVLSVMLEEETTPAQIEELFLAVKSECKAFGVTVVGGDTKQGKQFSICGAMIGEIEGAGWPISNARPGDQLYVTGPLGDVTAAVLAAEIDELEPFKSEALNLFGSASLPKDLLETLICSHVPAACTDISDGLGYSVNRLAARSGCVAEIHTDDLPVGSFAKSVAQKLHLPQMAFAFGYGGDFQFLFSIPATAEGLENLPLIKIGRLLSPSAENPRQSATTDGLLVGDEITSFGFLDFEDMSDAERFLNHAKSFK